ncbi:MAG: MurT ligase domain-containing protein [Solirubrobacteraceae bacterium]|nr:MAG: DUF1727 domain-containing protein [Solirubrobacterales bacterium]
MMLGAKVSVARALGAIARASGRGGGTSLPGMLLQRLDRDAIGTLARRLPRGSALLSATNGKTTTAALAANILAKAAIPIVHNRAGANMASGVASALLDAVGPKGTIKGELGLFEVDEFWLPSVSAQLAPRSLLLANLFRDQLDRYGELEAIADRWAAVVAAAPGELGLVLCSDDPLVADLGRGREATYFGVRDDRLALPEIQHAADSKHCRRCGAPLQYLAVYLGHLGRYRCPNGHDPQPEPTVQAVEVELHGVHSATFSLISAAGRAHVELPLPGLYNVYNALGAAALCLSLGVALGDVVAGLQDAEAAFGRAETIAVDGRALSIMLIKNPAGANEVLRTLVLEPGQHDVLGVLNDGIADGRDVSWIWDADFELLASRLRGVTCSGTRADELGVRLKYAGVAPEKIAIVGDLPDAFDSARAAGNGTLYALPTYTALLQLRGLLADRGVAARFWR